MSIRGFPTMPLGVISQEIRYLPSGYHNPFFMQSLSWYNLKSNKSKIKTYPIPKIFSCLQIITTFNTFNPTDCFSFIHNNEWKRSLQLLSVEKAKIFYTLFIYTCTQYMYFSFSLYRQLNIKMLYVAMVQWQL